MSERTLKVKAHALAFGGGIVCEPEGSGETRKIFVSGLIPGEEGQVKISGTASNFLHGELVHVSAPAPSRRDAPCVYFSQCGGCNLQYMTLEMQRQSKMEMIASMLQRQAGLPSVPSVTDVSSTLPEFGYRRRATFHLALDGRLGFYRSGSRDVVPIARCLIVENEINELLKKLQEVSYALAPFVGSIEVDCGERTTVICKLRDRISPFKVFHLKKIWNSLPNVQLKYKGKDLVYKNGEFVPAGPGDAGHFSQVNRAGNIVLVDEVLKRASGSSATELYAGSGNFTFPLADRGFRVSAVEVNPSLAGAGSERAARGRYGEAVSFFEMSCERFVRRHRLLELVIMDPPRAGALEVVRKADWSGVKSCIYISCNLPSLSRDLKLLVHDHKFSIDELLLVDMFPQTHHTEVIAVLRKGGDAVKEEEDAGHLR